MRCTSKIAWSFIVSVLLLLLPLRPADAAGVGNVEFSVNSTLTAFPCLNCSVAFTGSGSGAGNLSALKNGVHYDATFSILNGHVAGWANYTEPQLPFCPAYGSASGRVTLTRGSGITTGIVHSSATPHHTGTVSSVSFTLDFSYIRVGATPVVTVRGGVVSVSFYIPDLGSVTITNTIVGGAGIGVFEVDALQATTACLSSSRPLPFKIVGDATIAAA